MTKKNFSKNKILWATFVKYVTSKTLSQVSVKIKTLFLRDFYIFMNLIKVKVENL